jgi:membrane fusion protein (multidrug efflux system)
MGGLMPRSSLASWPTAHESRDILMGRAGGIARLALCIAAMRYVITIAALILTIGILAGIKGAQIKTLMGFGEQMQKAGPPPEAVNAAPVERQKWERTLEAVATVVSSKGVAVSNDAPGVVSRLHFDSGDKVKAGQPLVELDAGVERAQLESLRARLVLANQSLQRTKTLIAQGVSTQAELDAQDSAYKGLVADMRAIQAQIERKTVRAPFAGKLGIRSVNLGQYLAPGTVLTVLESADSVFVDFTLPQQDLPNVAIGRPVRVRADAGGKVIASGTISAVDSSVDAVTRSLKIRASFPDGESVLRTGMFVNAEVVLPETADVVAVPATAVIHAPYGDSVFVVEPKQPAGESSGPEGAQQGALVARQQFVRLGGTRGDFVAIEAGVDAGQKVVSAGAFKLRNQAPISIKNEVGVEAQLNPRPENR